MKPSQEIQSHSKQVPINKFKFHLSCPNQLQLWKKEMTRTIHINRIWTMSYSEIRLKNVDRNFRRVSSIIFTKSSDMHWLAPETLKTINLHKSLFPIYLLLTFKWNRTRQPTDQNKPQHSKTIYKLLPKTKSPHQQSNKSPKSLESQPTFQKFLAMLQKICHYSKTKTWNNQR